MWHSCLSCPLLLTPEHRVPLPDVSSVSSGPGPGTQFSQKSWLGWCRRRISQSGSDPGSGHSAGFGHKMAIICHLWICQDFINCEMSAVISLTTITWLLFPHKWYYYEIFKYKYVNMGHSDFRDRKVRRAKYIGHYLSQTSWDIKILGVRADGLSGWLN